ncbi:UBC-like protein [Phycomyces blakesleeanus]
MATKAAYKRLSKEYLAIQKNPPPFITAKPLESNILEWHYVIQGPPDTPYLGGEYYGRLTFPSEYPYKPPAIRMVTPSGRFQPDTRLCLTMSDFHPSLWNPSWSVATILNGLLSFMTTDETTTGSIKTTDSEKRFYAARSHIFNLKIQKFRDVFPELCTIPDNAYQLMAATETRKRANTTAPTTVKARPIDPQTPHAQRNESTWTRTVSQWKRWVLVLVLFVYLIMSKLAARSSSASEGGS